MTTLERAEAAEHALSEELDRLVIVKSVIYTSGERDPRVPVPRPPDAGKRYLMADDPRLPRMPEKPTLFDFFKLRFTPANHLLQSARLAQKSGAGDKVVLACLLHDIAIAGFIRGDHGRSEEHTSELQSQSNLVCRLLLEKKKRKKRVKQGRRTGP